MHNKKILLVDDDPDVTLGMHLRLRANHYQTFFAADAPSSVKQAQRYEPDLIVLDLGLPAGDGYQVMQALKQVPALARTPVIVISARDFITNEDRVLESGACAYLQKPVDNARLLKVIREKLGETA